MARQKKSNPVAQYKAGGKLSSADESFFQSPYYQDSYDFPYNPDSLCSGNNYNVYDEMRHDDQVKACLSLKKDMVMGTGYHIVCDNPEVKEAVENNFKYLNDMALELSFEETLRDICSFFDYGFSLSEVIYALVDGQYKLDSIRVRPPHSFLFDLDTKGNVKKLIQNGPQGPKELDSNKFLHFAYQSDFGNPYGLSDLKAAHLAWKIKKYFLKFYAKAGERFVAPLVVGKYDANLSGNEADRIYEILLKIQNSTTLVVPKEAEMEFVQPDKDTLSQYDSAIKTLNLWIARAILVPDLLGLSGDQTAGGSYALGGTQFKMFLSTISKVRDQIARKITARVIMPMVKANWGEGIDCKFEFNPFNQADEVEYSKMWLEAIKAGVKPNEAQINNFLDIVKYPQFEAGEAMFDKPAPAPLPGEQKPPQGQAEAPAEPEDKGEEDEQEEAEKPEVKEMAEKWPREFTQYERKVNFTEIKRELDTFESRLTPRVITAANKVNASIIDQIKSRDLVTGFKPEQIEKLKPKFMREMNFLFKKHFTDLFYSAAKEAKAEIVGKDNMGKYVDSEILPEEFIDIIEAESFNMVKDYASGVLKKAQGIVAEGIKRGVPQAEIVKQILEANKQFADRWVATMVRTKTTEVYNAARKTYWETDELAKDIVVAYQYSAIMDDRTSEICRHLDGKVFEKGDFINRVTPPAHHNCFVPGTIVRGKGKRAYTKIEDINVGDLVLTQSLEYLPVVEFHRNPYDGEIVVIELDNGKILKATPNHPIFTQNRGWVNAGELLESDILVDSPNSGPAINHARDIIKWTKEKDNIVSAYKSGKSTRQIAKKYNVYGPVIAKWLSYFGVELRHGSEAVRGQWVNNFKRREQASKIFKASRKNHPHPRLGKKDPGQAERMRNNNPMWMPGVKEKAIAKKISLGINSKGKNNPMYGKSPIHPQIINYNGMRLRSSYELKFVKYMEANGIKFDYEPKRFDLGFCTYVPDFFTYDKDGKLEKVVEIKGWVKEKDLKKVSALREIMLKDGVEVVMYSQPELKEMGVI